MEAKHESMIHQILIKLLNGNHKFLNFTTPIVSVETLKNRIQTLTLIPPHLQLLTLSDSRILHESHSLDLSRCSEKSNGESFPVAVHLLLRLRGGKGGFGSLLRGAPTKAGQKKTNNFDACRDMSGRRLRHVNAEKKLEEWRAEAEERKLEKMAEEYIKKKTKEVGGKKAKGNADAEKYVAKYRADSAKCMEEVERTVRESFKGFLASKRKGAAPAEGSEAEAKRMKIWLGKRIADSDSDDMDEDDSDSNEEEETEKSVVTNNGNNSNYFKEAESSPDSVTGAGLDVVSSEKGTSDNGSEEEKNVVFEESPEPGKSGDISGVHGESKSGTRIVSGSSEERIVLNGSDYSSESVDICRSESLSQEKEVDTNSNSENIQQTVGQPPLVASSTSREDRPSAPVDVNSTSEPVPEERSTSPEATNLEKPLNFDEYNSAAELEVLGMERLKSELQARGLKCGGTLQERAARLFLLKTTPLEKLSKKLFAKK